MSRYDYANASDVELAAWMRQFRRNRRGYSCEFGHYDCGCTNARTMSGIAPCSVAVYREVQRRKETASV